MLQLSGTRWHNDDPPTDKTFAVPGGANPDPTNSRASNAFFRSPNLLSFIANPGGAQANSIQQTDLLTGVVSTVVSSTLRSSTPSGPRTERSWRTSRVALLIR